MWLVSLISPKLSAGLAKGGKLGHHFYHLLMPFSLLIPRGKTERFPRIATGVNTMLIRCVKKWAFEEMVFWHYIGLTTQCQNQSALKLQCFGLESFSPSHLVESANLDVKQRLVAHPQIGCWSHNCCSWIKYWGLISV